MSVVVTCDRVFPGVRLPLRLERYHLWEVWLRKLSLRGLVVIKSILQHVTCQSVERYFVRLSCHFVVSYWSKQVQYFVQQSKLDKTISAILLEVNRPGRHTTQFSTQCCCAHDPRWTSHRNTFACIDEVGMCYRGWCVFGRSLIWLAPAPDPSPHCLWPRSHATFCIFFLNNKHF